MMCNSNLEIEKKLRDMTRRNIRIPSGIQLCRINNTIKMKLSSIAVSSNMQEDASAFEGWALALQSWFKYHVIISWDRPDLINNEHYHLLH